MGLTTYTITQLLQLKPPSWLIEKTIPEAGLIALYGAPGHGKSFIALDMALAVASGRDWQGHKVQQGYVVYISAEGGSGISKRVGAWLTHHAIKPQDYQYIMANFVVAAIRIHPDSEDLSTVLADTINHPDYQSALSDVLDPDEDRPPLFIIVDTLARCFEGDENQQEDMGNFIKGLDDLREQYDATVLVVHHTGKHGVEERGSSAFRGACDTMMLAELSEKSIILSCTKQKDYDVSPDKELDLIIVLEWDSCVIVPSATEKERKQAELRENVAEYLLSQPDASVREIFELFGTSKSTIHRMIQQIREKP